MQWLRRTFWGLLLLNAILLLSGTIDAVVALSLVAAIELATAGIALMLGWQAFRQARNTNDQSRLLTILTTLVPQHIARFIVLEISMLWTLARWIGRRLPDPKRSFSYARRSLFGALTVLVLLTAPAEILLLHLLLPWDWIRWLAIGLSLYGLLWLVALWAAERVWPHQVVGDVLVLRWLFLHEIRLPLASIQQVMIEPAAPPKGRDGLILDDERAFLAVGGRTDISLTLTQPAVGLRYLTPTRPFRSICVAVDDPERLQRVLSQTRSVPHTN